jgi:hypothetical protein
MKARFLLLLLCVGCTVLDAKYNLVVPDNTSVDNSVSKGENIYKRYCSHFLFGIIPVSKFVQPFNTDKYTKRTIAYFNKQGFEGNVLVDVTFKNQFLVIPLVWTAGCLKIEGTMATLKEKT